MLSLQDRMYEEVVRSMTKGAFIFLGTPHRGSESASTLHRVLSATIGSKSFIQELMTNSTTLTAINEDFRHHAKDLKLWSFHETMPTSTGPGISSVGNPARSCMLEVLSIADCDQIVVERSSATLGYDNEGSTHIHGDHHTICKFAAKDDPGYQTIRKLLVRLVSDNDPPGGSRYDLTARRRTARTSDRTVLPPKVPTSREICRVLGQDDTTDDYILGKRHMYGGAVSLAGQRLAICGSKHLLELVSPY